MLDPKGFNRELTLIDLTCDSKKCLIHMINIIASSNPISSSLVELFVLMFCFDNKDKNSRTLMLDILRCDFYNLDVL